MTKERECDLIRTIAREQCELEAAKQASLTHTAIEHLPDEQLTDDQCVLLWAAKLEKDREASEVETRGKPAIIATGTPSISLNPYGLRFRDEDAKQAGELKESIAEQTRLRAASIKARRKTKAIENRIDKLHKKLADLAMVEPHPTSMAGRVVWANLQPATDAIVMRAKLYVSGRLKGPVKVVGITSVALKPYKWPDNLAEDKWIYDNIHLGGLDDLKVGHAEWCQSHKKSEKLLVRNRYKARSDRYCEYHGLPKRLFKNACNCPECQGVSDTQLTGDSD